MHYTLLVRIKHSTKKVFTYSKGNRMKKMMILIAAMAMATVAIHANEQVSTTISALETQAPTPTEGDTNGTTEETVPQGK